MEQENIAIRTSYFSILSNILLAVIKAASGVLGNSYALIADAIESTVDVFSSILVLFGLKYAKRPADKNHPYGHGKIEPFISIIVAAFIVISAIVIIYESIQNIQVAHKVPKPWTLIVLALIIIWKELSYRRVMKSSVQTNSSVLKADAWHHRSDAITSVTAFIGIAIALCLGKGYESADDWAAIVAALIILYNAYLIFRPAIAELMDEHVYDDLIDEIRLISVEVDGVLETEKCMVRKSGMKYHVDLHAIVDGEISVKEGHLLAHNLKDRLMQKIPNIGDILIHIEPNTF